MKFESPKADLKHWEILNSITKTMRLEKLLNRLYVWFGMQVAKIWEMHPVLQKRRNNRDYLGIISHISL